MDRRSTTSTVTRCRLRRLVVVVASAALLVVGAVTAPVAAAPRADAGLGDARDLLRRLAPRAVDLGVATDMESIALYVTESGWVMGTTLTSANGRRVFRWKDGVARVLQEGGTSSRIEHYSGSANERGQVVVTVFPAGDATRRYVVLWQPDGSVVRLSEEGVPASGSTITEGGAAVGTVETPTGRRAVLWRDGETIDLGDLGHEMVAYDVDDREQVTGVMMRSDNVRRAFLWRAGHLMELPTPPGTISSDPYGFTEDGAVHGAIENPAGRTREVVWVDGGMPRDFEDACADSRQVRVADHLPAAVRDRWPSSLGTVVLDTCPPREVRTPRGGPGHVLGGNDRGVHVGFGYKAGTFYRDPIAWVHGLPVPLQELAVPAASGAVALDVNDRGLVVGYQEYQRPTGTGPWSSAVLWRLAPGTLSR